jgi:hypothetical protein
MTNLDDLLSEKVADAMKILIPKFGVSPKELSLFNQPVIRGYSGRSHYLIDKNELEISERQLLNYGVIGEEVSHYIHSQINPSLNDISKLSNSKNPLILWGISNQVRCIREVIGRYGGLICAYEKGILLNKTIFTACSDDAEEFHDDLGHNIGYITAEKIFEAYGDSLLPKLSRMSFSELIHILPLIAPITWSDRITKSVILMKNKVLGEKSF